MPRRQLFLLRHAKSAWNTGASTDFDRPLSKRGESDAPKIGKWLFDHGHIPERIICSPAKRARNTSKKVLSQLGLNENQMSWEPRVYGASLNKLLCVLRECDSSVRKLMLVGHNPGLEDLLTYLCQDAIDVAETAKLFPTAAVAIIKSHDSWFELKPDSAVLEALIRPKSLA